MSRYPDETTARFDQQFAETESERNERVADARRRRGNSKLVYDKARRTIVAVKTGQCDCCGKEAELTKLIAFGIDTAACAECRGE